MKKKKDPYLLFYQKKRDQLLGIKDVGGEIKKNF